MKKHITNTQLTKIISALTCAVYLGLGLLTPMMVQAQMTWDDVSSVVKNKSYYRKQCGTDSTSSAQQTGIATGKLYMIGDSITAGANNQLNTTLTTRGFNPVDIDGVASRSLSEGGGPLNGIGVLERSKDRIKGAGVVVIALGTNAGVSDQGIQRAIDIIKSPDASPEAKIFWVNIGANNAKRTQPGTIDQEGINEKLRTNAGKGYTVIDWGKVVSEHPDYISGDGYGVHTEGAGTQAFADTVAAGATGGAAPVTYNNQYQNLSNRSKDEGLFTNIKNKLIAFAIPTASAQSAPTNTAVIPIPNPQPIVSNDGITNAEIPADRLTDMKAIPNVNVTGSNLIRKEIVPNLTELAQAFKTKFGRDLHIFSGYRDLAQQQQSLDAALAQGNTNTVAPLGQSSHGWGLAIDIEQAKLDSGDTDKDFKSEEYTWLATEGVKMGWKNPYYQGHGGEAAEEPWHWEYGTTSSWGAGNDKLPQNTQGAATSCACTTGSKTTGPTNLTGSDNAEQIFNFFVSSGYAPTVAAGFIGNMSAESGLNPRALEPGTTGDFPIAGRGYGLIQWTFPDRQDPLKEQAAAKGKPVHDLQVQLEYIIWELENKYKDVNDRLKNIANETPRPGTEEVDKATEILEIHYETHAGMSRSRPETPEHQAFQQSRKDTARDALAKFGSGVASTVTSGSATCAKTAGGQIVGGFSLPLDKKWYDENKWWFTKTHHSGRAASDIPVPTGTPVYSMTAGKITQAPNGTVSEGYGLGVTIDAGDGIVFYYGHGSDGGAIEGAKVGDTVEAGQLIMHSASTGSSTGPHLHLEIRNGDTKLCPQTLFVAIAEGTEIPNIKDLPTSGCTH